MSDLYELKSEELALAHQEIVLLDSLRQLDQKDRAPYLEKIQSRDALIDRLQAQAKRKQRRARWQKVLLWAERAGWGTMVVVLVVIGMGK